MGSTSIPTGDAWKSVLEIVLSTKAHTDISISKLDVPHPLASGFVKHFGDLAGQNGDYRLPLPDGKELHVKEYDKDFKAHWDMESAIKNPLGHLFWDAFHWFALICVVAFVIVLGGLWYIVSKRRNQTPTPAT